MKKYRFMLGNELSGEINVLINNGNFIGNIWYKVCKVFDICAGKNVYIIKEAYSLSDIKHFDIVRYIKDKHGNKKGVMVAFEGRIGWSMVHPKDMKECIINWDFAKALAAKRAVTFKYFDIRLIPQSLRMSMLHLSKQYEAFCEKKNGIPK